MIMSEEIRCAIKTQAQFMAAVKGNERPSSANIEQYVCGIGALSCGMTEDQKSGLFTMWRDLLRQEREALKAWKKSGLRSHSNGIDTTVQDVLDWEARIDDLEDLIKRITADGFNRPVPRAPSPRLQDQ